MRKFLGQHKIKLVIGAILLFALPLAFFLSQETQLFAPRATTELIEQSRLDLTNYTVPQEPQTPFTVDLYLDTSGDPNFVVTGVDAIIEYTGVLEPLSIVQGEASASGTLTLTRQSIDPDQHRITIAASNPTIADKDGKPVGVAGTAIIARITFQATGPGNATLGFFYESPSSTTDTNVIGFEKNRLVKDQVPRERLLSHPSPQADSFLFQIVPSPSPTPVGKSCVRAGCSSQLCVDSVTAQKLGGLTTTCEVRPEYACYKTATCALQPDGQCGFTQTPELKACLDKSTQAPVNWKTDSVSLKADNFYITAHGQKFTTKNAQSLSLHSDPPDSGDPNYTTFEATWKENGEEMRLFIYFRKDNSNWWAYEIRSYGGPEPGKWVYYADANNPAQHIFRHSLGQTVIGSSVHLTPTSESQGLSSQDYNVHFDNLSLLAFTSPSPSIKPSPTPIPIKIQVELKPQNRLKNNYLTKGILYAFPKDTSPYPSTVWTIGSFTTNSQGKAALTIPSFAAGQKVDLFVRTPSHLIKALSSVFLPPSARKTPSGGLDTYIFSDLVPGDIYVAPSSQEQDNLINTFDALELMKYLGTKQTIRPNQLPHKADLNTDGAVNTSDLKIILNNLGRHGDDYPANPHENPSPLPVTTSLPVLSPTAFPSTP